MASVNKVVLVGNLGKDPEVRNNPEGVKVVTLSIATSERWSDKNTGEKKERTEWHRVVIFNEKIAEVAENYLKKGSKIYIEGQLQTRKWLNKKGEDVYTTEVVLPRFRGELIMLYKHNSDAEYAQDTQEASPSPAIATPQKFDNLADEVPF